MKYIFTLICLTLASCATTQNVQFSQEVEKIKVKSAYFVPHLGKSGDMDGYILNELNSHHISTQTGPEVSKNEDNDMLVKYSDSWSWDIAMYLKTLDVQFFNAKTGYLLAQGHWENSSLHSFPDAGEIVKKVMNQMFEKIKVNSK